MDVAPPPRQLDRRPGAGRGYDVLGHHAPGPRPLFVLDYFEEHERRGVLLPVCGGPAVYLDGAVRPKPEPDFEALLDEVNEQPPFPPEFDGRGVRQRRPVSFAERRLRHHGCRRTGRPGGRVGSEGVMLGAGCAFEFEELFRPADDVEVSEKEQVKHG